jgi:OOP family OmpA-OmpF porin
MNRFWNSASILAIPAALATLSMGEGVARAQSTGFSLDRFDPAAAGSTWFALDSLDLRGSGRPAFAALLDYANKPLVLYNPDGSTRSVIVNDQLFLHLAGSMVVLDRLRFAFNLPIAVQQQGGSGVLDGLTYQGPNKAALGDLRLDADVRLAGVNGDPFTIALGAQVFLPTGSRTLYTSDGGVRFAPHLLAAGEVGMFAYAASLGLVVHAQDEQYAGIPIGGELTMGASAGLLLADKHLLVGPEVWGRTDVTDHGEAFVRDESPVEGLLGVHVTTNAGWRFGLGGGAGFAEGLGSPSARVVASIEFAPPPEGPRDRDGDGILDLKDACPDEPGVATDDTETNGCPPKAEPPPPPPPPAETDRDKDGILDPVDACPDTPGERDPDPKKNGCPRAVVEHGTIKIMDQVKFATDSSDILPESDAILTAVLKILTGHPEIKRVDVQGYTDDRGRPDHNQDLSERRAASVVRWLTSKGIDPSRLISHGFGQTRAIDSNATDEGRQNNRRVEFHILGANDGSTPHE